MNARIWLTSLIKKAFPYRRQIARLSKVPMVAAAMHKTIFSGDDMIFLPKDRVVIDQAVPQTGSVVLPSEIVDHFIRQASYRWIMNTCICREGDDCQDYPHDLGCIFLGEAVKKINSAMGYLASVEEAIAHAHRAAQLGLVHLIGRDRIDSLWTGGRPFGKLMTICHCCPCCCLFRVLPDLDLTNRAKVTRMPGVAVWVDADECLGCGQCAEQGCFVGAIEIVDGVSHISDECRGCGRCVEHCPQGAIHLRIEDNSFLQTQIARISSLVSI